MPHASGGGNPVTTNVLQQSIIKGDAYRVSTRITLSDAEELIVHIDPNSTGGTVYVEAPAIQTEQRADFDVFENADPGTGNFAGDLEIHNMRYDSGTQQETPDALVDRVTNGNLDTTNADKTEESYVDTNNEGVNTGSPGQRSIWRIIPTTDIISIIITDRSGGTNNNYALDMTIYEGETLPE